MCCVAKQPTSLRNSKKLTREYAQTSRGPNEQVYVVRCCPRKSETRGLGLKMENTKRYRSDTQSIFR